LPQLSLNLPATVDDFQRRGQKPGRFQALDVEPFDEQVCQGCRSV
jgi:hypothetical protein